MLVFFFQKHQISKDAWETSGLKVKEGKANHSPLALATRYAIPIRDQVPIIMRKFNRLYWRSPSYNFVRLLVTVATALVFGSLYWGQGNIKDSTDIGQVQNAMGVLFTGMSFMGMTNLITSLPIVAAEREVYFRERAASMYSSAPFAVVSGLVEVPYLFLQVRGSALDNIILFHVWSCLLGSFFSHAQLRAEWRPLCCQVFSQ